MMTGIFLIIVNQELVELLKMCLELLLQDLAYSELALIHNWTTLTMQQ
jgi:hypothetical protein